MFSSEHEKKTLRREEQRKECEQLALKKKDVRRKVHKYDRRQGSSSKTKASGGGKGLKGILRHSNKHAEQTARTSARLELLLNEEPGYVEADGLERTFRYRQSDMMPAVPVASQQNYFDLKLEQLGPYCLDYSRNGRHLLIAGSKGHIASVDWKDKRLGAEFHVREVVRDVQFLHNEMMYAVAQKRHVFIYDHTGMELHCLKNHDHVNCLTFLPYHFLLVSADDHGTLRYLDTSTGQSVAEIRTKLGALKCMAQNPHNAIVGLGHHSGCVSLWSPSETGPLVKLQCHRGPLTALAVDTSGHYLTTAAMDAKLKVWDVRTYRPLHTHSTPRPVVCMDISGRGLLAVGRGQYIDVWRDAFSQVLSAPYLTHRVKGEVRSMKFCPFEDCLGVGHGRGFSSMLVPGAGEPNFDATEANPFQTKRQRQETEVKQLLDKVPAELIQLEPGSIGRLKPAASRGGGAEAEGEGEGEVGAGKKKRKSKVRGKDKALQRQKRREELARVKRRQVARASLQQEGARQEEEESEVSSEEEDRDNK